MVEEGAHGEPSLRNLLEDARSLDLHYIPSRYPNGLPAGYPHQFYAADTADRAIASADKILAAVTGHYGGRHESAILSDESERSGPS